jgi:hypothetical protein
MTHLSQKQNVLRLVEMLTAQQPVSQNSVLFTVRNDSPAQHPHSSLTAALLSFFASDL